MAELSLECKGGIQCLLLNCEKDIKEDNSKKSKANFLIVVFAKCKNRIIISIEQSVL